MKSEAQSNVVGGHPGRLVVHADQAGWLVDVLYDEHMCFGTGAATDRSILLASKVPNTSRRITSGSTTRAPFRAADHRFKVFVL